MKTQEPQTANSFKTKFGAALNKTQQELEEMAVQFSLGKAEAGDKFEETKKEFKDKIHEWKQFFQEQSIQGKEGAHKVLASLEELIVQLSLGKAEAKDYFEKQKKSILGSMEGFEKELQANPTMHEMLSDFKAEGEKLKLKLEILQLKFELKKFKITDDFKSAMREVKVEAEKVFDKVEQKWDKTKSKYTDFNDELSLVYKHLKKAIRSL